MEYARTNPARLRLVRPSAMYRAGGSKLRAGVMPGVSARDFDRKYSLEDAFPVLILGGFALLASIQYLLLQ